jgi:hypothetical protein
LRVDRLLIDIVAYPGLDSKVITKPVTPAEHQYGFDFFVVVESLCDFAQSIGAPGSRAIPFQIILLIGVQAYAVINIEDFLMS